MRADDARLPDLSTRLALRPAEAAAVLGISQRKLRGMLSELPVVRRGGCVLIPVDALREWLREQAQVGTDTTTKIVAEVMEKIGE